MKIFHFAETLLIYKPDNLLNAPFHLLLQDYCYADLCIVFFGTNKTE